jgi:ABC-type glycerol-3-phosphate transport system substrate-binding protein
MNLNPVEIDMREIEKVSKLWCHSALGIFMDILCYQATFGKFTEKEIKVEIGKRNFDLYFNRIKTVLTFDGKYYYIPWIRRTRSKWVSKRVLRKIYAECIEKDKVSNPNLSETLSELKAV